MSLLTQSIGRNGALLGLFAVITTGIVAATYLGTQDQIRANIRIAEEAALLEIVPRDRHNNAMLDDAQAVVDSEVLGLREEKKIYVARQDTQVVSVILPATARDGYTGDIDLIVGINVDGTIAGVRVLSHRETPGLGDAVDTKKSDWVLGFNGKSLVQPALDDWKVKKDGGAFDQFTGATITPRAVTRAVRQALEYFEANRFKIIATSDEMLKQQREEADNG